MNNTVKIFLAFLSGTAVGSAVTYFLLKRKHEKLLKEEVKSIKEHYEEKGSYVYAEPKIYSKEECEELGIVDTNSLHPRIGEEPDEVHKVYAEYKSMLDESGYATEAPYIIEPEDFGELSDYSQVCLIYYADGYLADENEELVEDPLEFVGDDYMNRFGEYEDDPDVVYMRNDVKMCDYEILRSLRLYRDLLVEKPYLLREEE